MLLARLLVLLAPQFWVKGAFAQFYGNITYGQTVTYGSNTYAETYLTPTARGTTWYWSQAITPAILGTVFVVINDHNQTETITSTNSAAVASNTKYLVNGTLSLLTRTDVNELGTVTTALPSAGDREIVVAYPTPYFTVVDPVSWQGLFPSLESGITCCNSLMATTSAVPQNHYSFPSLTGSTDSDDPRGWLYAMTSSSPEIFSGAQDLSSLLSPATIMSVRQHCPYDKCAHYSSAEGALGVQMAGALLETSTVHVTGTFSTSAAPAGTSEQSRETSTTSASTHFTRPGAVDSPSAVETQGNLIQSAGAATTDAASSQGTRPGGVAAPSAVDEEGDLIQSAGAATTDAASAVDFEIDPLNPPKSPHTLAAATVTPADALLSVTTTLAYETVQPTSKLLGVISTAAAPTPTTAAEDVGAAIVQLLGSTSSPNADNVLSAAIETAPDSTASKEGATGVQTAEHLMTVDASFFAISAVTATTQAEAASQLSDSLPEPSASPSAGNIGDAIVALLGSGGATASAIVASNPASIITAGGTTAVSVDESSTHILPQPTTAQGEVVSRPPIVIGSSTVIPNSHSQYIIAGQTLEPGSSITLGGTPIALQTDAPEGNVVVIGTSSSVLQQQAVVTPPPIIIGSSTISANSDSQYIVAGQTLAPGSSIDVGGTPIALQTDAPEGNVLVIGTSSSLLQEPAGTPPPIIIGSSTITANSDSQYIVAGQTLEPGSSITVGGTPIALQTDKPEGNVLVVGTSSSVLQQQQPEASAAAPPIVIAGSTIIANSASEYVVAGQTLAPGSSITIGSGPSASVIALHTEGSNTILVVGSSSSILASQPTAVLTVGAAKITPIANSEYVVGSRTLVPGASAITVSGIKYSLASDGGELVAGTSTQVLTALTIGSAKITPIANSEYVIGSQTLTPGAPAITVSGVRYSLASDGGELVAGSSTQVLTALTIGSAKVTPIANSEYVIGSQTLTPGASAITVSGIKYSLAPDGGELVAGSSTAVLTSEAGIGDFIWSALGGSSEESGSTTKTRESTQTTGSGISSTGSKSQQASATGTQKAGAAEVARPLCLWSLVALSFWVVGGL